MLLSIDRVLQLLAEGKSLIKIAELADCEADDVVSVIEDARRLIIKYDKQIVKRKIIIKSRGKAPGENAIGRSDDENVSKLFKGSELSAIPVESSLTIYTDGASMGNPGPSGIGIVIYDREDRQVGKVSSSIRNGTNNVAEYSAILRALKIAAYFKTKTLKIRTDSELVVKQMNGEYRVKNKKIQKLYDEAIQLKKKIVNFKIEHVTRNLNDKADYLAKIAASGNKGN